MFSYSCLVKENITGMNCEARMEQHLDWIQQHYDYLLDEQEP